MNLDFSLDVGRINRGFDGGHRFRLGTIASAADEESARKENDPESGRTAFENHVAFPSSLDSFACGERSRQPQQTTSTCGCQAGPATCASGKDMRCRRGDGAGSMLAIGRYCGFCGRNTGRTAVASAPIPSGRCHVRRDRHNEGQVGLARNVKLTCRGGSMRR